MTIHDLIMDHYRTLHPSSRAEGAVKIGRNGSVRRTYVDTLTGELVGSMDARWPMPSRLWHRILDVIESHEKSVLRRYADLRRAGIGREYALWAAVRIEVIAAAQIRDPDRIESTLMDAYCQAERAQGEMG